MSFFKRLFKIGEAEAHSTLDKMEDPIKMTEQGIRDLKTNLDNAMKAFAELKAVSIRTKREGAASRDKARDYEQKAIALLKKAQSGQLDPTEADRLATEALNRKSEAETLAIQSEQDNQRFEAQIGKLDMDIKKLKTNVAQYENQLRTLKARSKVSEATKNVNKQMAQLDSSSTVAMLERMKEKVEQQEALAEAYGEIAGETKSLDSEINSALESHNISDALSALKSKLALDKPKDIDDIEAL